MADLIRSRDQLERQMRRFLGLASSDTDWARKHARSTTYWLFDESLQEFGPNKWCGYDIQTVDGYKSENQADAINGKEARDNIEDLLAEKYRADDELRAQLHDWAVSRFGAEALSGLKESKWKFLRFHGRLVDLEPAQLITLTSSLASSDYFDATNVLDARERSYREIVERRGQPKFRKEVAAAYNNRCAITGTDFLPVLEAAHIVPYLGPDTNHVSNGLLLRADIHTLFDLNLIAVNPSDLAVHVTDAVAAEDYRRLHGTRLSVPSRREVRPDLKALEQRWDEFLSGNA